MNDRYSEASPPRFRIPTGLDSWIIKFVEDAQRETEILHENGAHDQATARICLIRKLLSEAERWLTEEITVEEASKIVDCHPETLRRMVRSGQLPDTRAKKKEHIKVQRGQVLKLTQPRTSRYEVEAYVQEAVQRGL